jgi:hypothetical protein
MRMSNESARFASAIFVGVLVALSPTPVFFGDARAADNCLSEPNGETPAGKHWYYRIEHGTGRHCWYLRGEDEKATRAGASEFAPPAAENSRKSETEAARSIADAHAELPPPRITAAVTPSAPPAPTDAAGSVPAIAAAPSQATSPWPAPPTLAQSGQSADATVEERADPQTVPVPEPQPAQTTERNIGSLQKLLLVAFGALALAGLTGSAVYRLAAGARRRARRKDRWPKKAATRAASSSAVSGANSRVSGTTAPKLADDMRLPAWAAPELDVATPRRAASLARDESEYPDDRVEKIEDFLVRLTKQLEAEMEKSRLH